MSGDLYATPRGRRYHGTPHCEGLASYDAASGRGPGAAPRITRANAAKRKLQPCGHCTPPPLLRVVA